MEDQNIVSAIQFVQIFEQNWDFFILEFHPFQLCNVVYFILKENLGLCHLYLCFVLLDVRLVNTFIIALYAVMNHLLLMQNVHAVAFHAKLNEI